MHSLRQKLKIGKYKTKVILKSKLNALGNYFFFYEAKK